MRILAAAYVLPITGDPIRDGAVMIDGSEIVGVGSRDELIAAHTSVDVTDFATENECHRTVGPPVSA